MPIAKITFNSLIQDSQEYGSDDQHRISRAFFSIEIDGNEAIESYVSIKQTVGTDFETASLEVSRPYGYSGPFNYTAFRQIVESYYRGLVGKGGSGISISGEGNIRMLDNRFGKRVVCEIEVSKESPTW